MPDIAYAIPAQKLTVPQSHRGMMWKVVADPLARHTAAATTTSNPPSIHDDKAPRFCVHLPTLSPTRFEVSATQIAASATASRYRRLSLRRAKFGPSIEKPAFM